MDHFLGLSGDLRRFFVNYVEVIDGRNSRVRYCNRIIKKLQTHIDKIKTSIKNKFNNKDFKDTVEVIHKSREKVFKITKS